MIASLYIDVNLTKLNNQNLGYPYVLIYMTLVAFSLVLANSINAQSTIFYAT
jgi:hypothetical protein